MHLDARMQAFLSDCFIAFLAVGFGLRFRINFQANQSSELSPGEAFKI